MMVLDPVVHRAQIGSHPLAFQTGLWLNKIGSSKWIYPITLCIILQVWFCEWRNVAPSQRLKLHSRAAAAWYVLTSVGTSEIVATVLKQAIGRPRPTMAKTHAAFGFEPFSFDYQFASLPSGHAATIACLATCLALLYPKLRVPVIVLAFSAGLSRIAIGVHYPGDVIAGFLLGICAAFAMAALFARRGILFAVRPGQAPVPVKIFGIFSPARG